MVSPVNVTEMAASKIAQLLDEEKKTEAGLRVFVQGGGCSGFQYGLMIEEGTGDPEADRIFKSKGVTIFVDPISIRYYMVKWFLEFSWYSSSSPRRLFLYSPVVLQLIRSLE